MSMTISDIGRTLSTLDETPSSTTVLPLISAHGQQWSVLTVASGDTWSTTNAPSRALSALGIEGHATWSDESGRQSVGSGHIVIVEPGTTHTVTNITRRKICL